MSEITHTNTPAGTKSSNFKLIVGLVVALGVIVGGAYGFYSGVFKPEPAALEDIPTTN